MKGWVLLAAHLRVIVGSDLIFHTKPPIEAARQIAHFHHIFQYTINAIIL